MVLLFVLIAIILILLIKIGVSASYSNGQLKVDAKLFFAQIAVYPRDKKPKQERKPKVKRKHKKLDLSLNDWLNIAKSALNALSKLLHKIRVDYFNLTFISSDADPYDAVMRFNAVNALYYGLVPYVESSVTVKKKNVLIDTDLSRENSVFNAAVSLSLTVGQVLLAALTAGFSILKIIIKRKVKIRRENNGKQSKRNDAVNDEQHKEAC